MVKTSGPLMSLEAHGSVGKAVTYSTRKGKNVARAHNYPRKKVTGPQWTQRHTIGMITARWQTMTDNDKAVYIASAKNEKDAMTGFNYFVKVAQEDPLTHLGLVLYLPMNEKTGATLSDKSGNGNHGTLSPTYPSDAPTRIAGLSEKYGNAIDSDGVNNYVDCGNDVSLDLTDKATYMVWFNIRGGSVNANMMSKMKTTPTINGFNFGNDSGGRGLRATIANASSFVSVEKPVEDIPLDTWHHGCFTLDGTNMRLYLDAIEVDSSAQSLDMGVSDENFLLAKWTTRRYNGRLDEVKVFDRALSLEEIQKHYHLLRQNKKRQPKIVH